MHEYRVLDVSGESAAVLESRLNEMVDSGWLVDRITFDSEGKPRILFLMRVRTQRERPEVARPPS